MSSSGWVSGERFLLRLEDDVTGLSLLLSGDSSERDARPFVGDNIASQRALEGEGDATEKAMAARGAPVHYRMMLYGYPRL